MKRCIFEYQKPTLYIASIAITNLACFLINLWCPQQDIYTMKNCIPPIGKKVSLKINSILKPPIKSNLIQKISLQEVAAFKANIIASQAYNIVIVIQLRISTKVT